MKIRQIARIPDATGGTIQVTSVEFQEGRVHLVAQVEASEVEDAAECTLMFTREQAKEIITALTVAIADDFEERA